MSQLAIESTLEFSPARKLPKLNWGMIGIVVLIAAYVAFLCVKFSPAISEPDDNGYFAQASLMMKTGKTWFVPDSDAQYIGMHWLITPKDQYISRYPPGLPLLIGVVYATLGFKASLLVNPVLATLTLVGLYLTAKRLVPTAWALLAPALLAITPAFNHHALSCDSHMAVAFCATWGLYFLVLWSQNFRIWHAFAAGIILGCIPTVRYPDAVIALGVAAFLLSYWRSRPRIGYHYVAAIVGAAVPIVPLLIRNQLVLGAFWRTGYALTNEQTGFSFEYFQQHAIDYVRQISANGVGPVLAIGVMGTVWMICMKKFRPLGLMITLFTVPMLLVYMAYYWAPQMNPAMTMRFLVPTFPMYILAAVWALAQATEAAPKPAKIAIPLVLMGVQLLWGTTETLSEVDRLKNQKQVLALATDALNEVAEKDAVVIAPSQILQHLDFVRNWKLADASNVRGGMGGGMGGPGMGGPGGGGMGGGPGGGGPGGGFGRGNMGGGPGGDPMNGPGGPNAMNNNQTTRPSPMQAEKRAVLAERYTGTLAQKQKKFAADVVAWAGGHKVYLVGVEQNLKTNSGLDSGTLKIIRKITLPEQPPLDQRDDGMGGMRRANRNGNGGNGGNGQRGGFNGGGGGNFGGPGGGGPGGGGMGGGGRGGMGGGGGGPMNMNFLIGEKEIVIAEWTPTVPKT